MEEAKKKYWSQRSRELDEMRFTDVRQLAIDAYRKIDDKPLLGYNQTLANRTFVKQAVLQCELLSGIISPDYENPSIEEEIERAESDFQKKVVDGLSLIRNQNDSLYDMVHRMLLKAAKAQSSPKPKKSKKGAKK